MEDIWNITALVVSVLSVLLSLYALRQATTKNTSDMYLFFISQYAKEDMKLALRKLKDIKRGVYRLEQWESDMKNNLPKAFEYDEARRLVKYFYDTLAYMKLEKLCNPEFNFEVNILNEVRYIQVPPLLFMPVIEYVIQTTVCGENGKGENIRIDFQMEENQLRFICTYCLRKKESLQVAPAFDKLRQRLDLLYPGGYQLKSGYNDEAHAVIRDVCENLRKEGCCPP